MKNYYKVMLGKKSAHAKECLEGNFIGADYNILTDLTPHLTSDSREFNHNVIPLYLKVHPEKSRIAAGLACGTLWTICEGVNVGDVVVCPNGHRQFVFGEVTGGYQYQEGAILQHRRAVKWLDVIVPRKDVSESLRNSTNSQGTSANISQHALEIEGYIAGKQLKKESDAVEFIEDPTIFALEKHLEDFLVSNWPQTELGKRYDIFEEDGELVGQQYPSDTGPIDILAISKDKKELLIVELKKGRASDMVVGQVQRYMGYVLEELAEDHQEVKGVIIALEDDLRIKRALKVTTNIEFYRYQVSFKLLKS